MTGVQLALDCDPIWTTPPDPTPTPWATRQAELTDLRDQHATLYGLYTATTVPLTGSYL